MYVYDVSNDTLKRKNIWYPKLRCFLIDKYKLIYIRILKNASSSIIDTLGLEFGNTQYYFDVQDKIQSGYKVFTILRDPFKRLVSAFAFHERANCYIDNKTYLTYRKYDNFKARFNAFVFEVKEHGYLNPHHYPQRFFITDIQDNLVKIDYFLNINNLNESIKKIMPVELSHFKKGNYENIELLKCVRDVINELYSEDYELLKRINV